MPMYHTPSQDYQMQKETPRALHQHTTLPPPPSRGASSSSSSPSAYTASQSRLWFHLSYSSASRLSYPQPTWRSWTHGLQHVLTTSNPLSPFVLAKVSPVNGQVLSSICCSLCQVLPNVSMRACMWVNYSNFIRFTRLPIPST